MNKDLIRFFSFILIFAVLFSGISLVFVKKKTNYINSYSGTSTLRGFYREPKNSIDVLVLGTSLPNAMVQPAVLWQEKGIKSYNLAMARQVDIVSYYLLKEAFKYQSPKIVLLNAEALRVVEENSDYIKMTDAEWGAIEPEIHAAIDFMKISPTKLEAVVNISRLYKDCNAIDFIFPFFRFHSRDDIQRDDFEWEFLYRQHPIKGAAVLLKTQPVTLGELTGEAEKKTVESSYMDKMIALCNEKGAVPILITPPLAGITEDDREAIDEYALKQNIEHVNFNTEEILRITGLNGDEDFEVGHLNILGAKKASLFLADYLTSHYNLRCRGSEAEEEWDKAYKEFAEIYDRFRMEIQEGKEMQ